MDGESIDIFVREGGQTVGKTNPRAVGRIKRKRRVRAKISGTPVKPRLTVFRSNKHIYAQVIDDTTGCTLCSASDISPSIRGDVGSLEKGQRAEKVGEMIAKQCEKLGIKKVVFDRNGYIYHGRIKELANGARKGGLDF